MLDFSSVPAGHFICADCRAITSDSDMHAVPGPVEGMPLYKCGKCAATDLYTVTLRTEDDSDEMSGAKIQCCAWVTYPTPGEDTECPVCHSTFTVSAAGDIYGPPVIPLPELTD